MTPSFTFPRTNDWLDRRLDLRARHQLRTVLRELERAADARLVVLWSVENNVVTRLVEFAGDDDAMPMPFPPLQASVPSREPTCDRQREEHDAVWQKIRMGGDAPTLGLAIVVPGVSDSRVLFDGVESTAASVEEIIINSVERSERERRRAQRDETRHRDRDARARGG